MLAVHAAGKMLAENPAGHDGAAVLLQAQQSSNQVAEYQ
jgi:hypothetical protein